MRVGLLAAAGRRRPRAALELLDGRIDALVTTVLGAAAATQRGRRRRGALTRSPRSTCRSSRPCARPRRAAWAASPPGSPRSTPRCRSRSPSSTGASSASPISFKEPLDDVAGRGAGCTTRPTSSAARGWPAGRRPRAAAARWTAASSASRSCSRASRPSTRGSATPSASTRRPARSRCSSALREAGYRVEHDFADGDELIHALIAAGGHDHEFLTDEQLAPPPARLPVADYADVVRRAARRAARRDGRDAGARRPASGTSTATTS